MMKKGDDDLFHLIPDENRRRKVSVLWLFVFIGFVLCFLGFGSWYLRTYSITVIEITSDKRKVEPPVCTGISDLDKFDCHPEDNASEKKCMQRGCCFQPNRNNFPPLNVPYCFYPTNYKGYAIGNISQEGRYLKADLKRSIPSGFPNDINSLQLVISFIDDNSLRIKITDAHSARFEVPTPINDGFKTLEKPSYVVKLNSETGVLTISRKATSSVIFKTSLAQLVYADQFLQISSDLPSPYIYGIGEQYGSFLRSVNWTRLTLLNSDRGPLPNYPLYGSHPFYLSLEEDGNANGVFLYNSNPMDVILQPTPAITFRPIGGILDFFVLLGPSPANVVQQYTAIVGRTFMPPYWSLGFQLCRYGYDSLNKTKETMQRTLDANIPLDVQWNDIDYMDKYKDFTYDEDKFAGLPEFVDDLHNRGMHYVIMTDPGISCSEAPGTYPPYDDGVKSDIFVKNPNGTIFRGKVWTDGETVYPDFSHPNVTAYWIRHFNDLYSKVKYDGVWIDMNEPSNFYDGRKDGCMKSSFEDPPYLPNGNLPLRHKTLCMTAKHYNTIHYNEHNLYAYREATATNQALKTIRQKRPFIISRASFAGQGIQSGHWSGDISSTWEDMRYSIRSLLNFNLYGMSMIGSDICGFSRNTTVPLCARWQSLGAFYPFSRNHNDRDSVEQDPAILGTTVIQATLNSLNIRYSFLPYLYTLFARSHVFGDTVIRPLFFEYPQDKNTYAIEEQFLWGPAMLINPVLYENAVNVTSYFPKGIWYGNHILLFNSKGEKVTVPVGITDISYAIRCGYLLPAQVPAKNTEASRKNPFMLLGCVDESMQAQGELYWDDGDSLDTYEKGNYNYLQFKVKNNTLTTTVVNRGYDDEMPVKGIQIGNIAKKPSEITVNGVNCIPYSSKNEEQKTNTFFQIKMFEKLNVTSKDPSCTHQFLPGQNALVITTSAGFSFLSPLTATWK